MTIVVVNKPNTDKTFAEIQDKEFFSWPGENNVYVKLSSTEVFSFASAEVIDPTSVGIDSRADLQVADRVELDFIDE